MNEAKEGRKEREERLTEEEIKEYGGGIGSAEEVRQATKLVKDFKLLDSAALESVKIEIVWNFIGKPEQGGNEQITERQRIVRHSLPTMPHCGKRIPFLMGMRLSRTHGFSIGYSAFAAKGLGIVSGGGQKATFSAR